MDSLNQHNQQYYREHGTQEVPDLLATAVPIQEAIRLFIEAAIPTDPIRVIELGFGSRPHRYLHIDQATSRQWQVVVTDFSLAVLPQPQPKLDHCTLDYLQYNLLTDPFPLPTVDVILSTYTFDSIQFPEDTFSRHAHYPGGLIRYIQHIQKHLSRNGIFLTIDKTATYTSDPYQPAGGAQFKTLDLSIAAKELSATFMLLDEFLAIHHQQLPINLSDHGCLVATKSTAVSPLFHP